MRPLILNGCQPRTLQSLMALYEQNYRLLMALIPDLDALPDHVISRVHGALDLHLSILERHKFTTEIYLTYRFGGEYELVLEPNLLLRVYHDARVAEILSHSRRQPMYMPQCRRHIKPSELDIKWELNRFLGRWLRYCGRQGHLFLDLHNIRNSVVRATDE